MKISPPISADLHLHTKYSHALHSAEAMYESALEKGLKIIGFSEHSPRPEGYTYLSDYQDRIKKHFPDYVKDVLKLKEKNNEEFEVLLGVELDYIPGHEDFAKKLISSYDFDYIIGGLHFQGSWGFDGPEDEWNNLDTEKRQQIYAQYYKDLKSMANTGFFNIAAHPDLIKIHTKKDFDIWLEKPQAKELISEALTAIKDNGMTMEISSAGLRKNCKEIYPGPKIMQIAVEKNIPISFGSDAHCTNTPAHAFKELASYAASYGYSKAMFFRNKKAFVLPFYP